MKRKTLLLLSSALMAAMLLGGCGKKEEEKPSISMVEDIKEETVEAEVEEEVEEEVVEEENHDGMYQSELTNEWIDESLKNQRPIAVMVDNEKTALPHYGLTDADVVYEIMNSTANDRITRLMVLIKDWKGIEQLGSIRSTRPTNILLAAEWNAILCHDGGPFYIDPYLAEDYSDNISGGFSRIDNGKAREFTEYITQEDSAHPDRTLDARIESSKVETEYNDFYEGPHYVFAEEEVTLDDAEDVIDATEIVLPFKHNKSTLKYNEETQTYDYYEYGDAHKDAGNDDKVLSFKNLLIQNCSFHQYDENGYLIYNCLDANREGYYVTNGKAIPVVWGKMSPTEPTRYFDLEGNEIKINTGKTYVTLVPDDGWDDMTIE